jgi:bacteriochlorophyllide a dehydrogenase
MNAKAVIFVQPKQVELGDITLPDPTDKDIVVETEVSGISVGTERWAYLGLRPDVAFPSVPGYMAVGRITSSGAQAASKGWAPGDRVYYFASRLAGEVEGKSWMGSHVSHAVVDVCGARGNGDLEIHHCEKVPSDVPAEEAALLGLCAVAMRGIEMAVVPVGAKVLVCGLGVIGQYALQVCQLKGASVTVTDIVEDRLKIAESLGATVAKSIGDLAPGSFDIIIDTSSSSQVVNSLFPLLKLRGKFVFQGWYPPPAQLDLNALHQRLPSAYFPCAHSAEAVGAALDWAAKGWLKSAPLITHTFSPEDAAQAYEMIGAGSSDFLGVIFDWRKK